MQPISLLTKGFISIVRKFYYHTLNIDVEIKKEEIDVRIEREILLTIEIE